MMGVARGSTGVILSFFSAFAVAVCLPTLGLAAALEDGNLNAEQRSDKSAKTLLAESLAFYERQDYRKALSVLDLRETLPQGERSAQVAMLEAMCCQHLGDFERATARLVEVLEHQDYPLAAKAGLLLASQYFMCGDFDGAETICSGVIEMFAPGRYAATAILLSQTIHSLKKRLAAR